MNSRILLVLLLGFFSTFAAASTTTTTTTTSTWRLPAGYYTPAKMPMTVVFPRPDSETNTWARQRIAYADGVMQYRIPVAIQGGAYPFHYQLVSGPSGMAIGQDYGDANYGIVTWTPTAQGGPYKVDVNVSDQDGNSIDVTWSVTANNSDFIFIDPNSPTNGTNGNGTPGSKTNPFNTFQGIGVIAGSGNTSKYAGKAIIFRAGVTALNGPETNGNYIMSPSGQNPCVLLGYTGEVAEIDLSSGVNGGGMLINFGEPDTFIGNLKIANAIPRGLGGETDTVAYFSPSQEDRTTFFENTFYNLPWYTGTGSSSNQSAITLWNPGKYRKYLSIIGNKIDNFSVALLDMYATQYAVIDNNQMLSGAASHMGGIWVKSSSQNVSIRSNVSLTHSYGYGAITIYLGEYDGLGNNNIEACYNTLLDGIATSKSTMPSDERQFVYGVDGKQYAANPTPHVYVYRNTILGQIRGYDFAPYIAYIENNILINPYNTFDVTSGTYKTVYATDITQNSPTGNLYGMPSDGYIDQNGNIIGTFASQYRGKVGAEIGSGYTPLNAPSWQ